MNTNLNEDKLTEITIDFNKIRENKLNESKDKARLEGAVSSFERTTGIKWPFK